MALDHRPAFWTYEDQEGGHAYYFAPANRRPSPYLRQVHVTAILDVADDGTLAGVELVMGDLPPPPAERFFNEYFQGPQRTVIQVERRESRDWIVWNWNHSCWDKSKHKIAADGKPEAV